MNPKKTHNIQPVAYFGVDSAEKEQENFSKSEEEIWDHFRGGDEKALVLIYRQYANRLYNYGMQFHSDGDFILDCIQEMFYELIRRRQGLGKTTSIKYYLYSSFRRLLWDRLMKEKRLKKEQLNSSGSNFKIDFSIKNFSLMEDPFDYEQKDIIKKACNDLPFRQKEAILLSFYEGLSYQEIASIMQIKDVKYARTLVYRALESLRNILVKFREDILTISIFLLAHLIF